MFLWRQVPPLMTFCGQWETTWQHLTEISQAGVDNCTLLKPPSMKWACTRVCQWAFGRARMDDLLCEDWLWSRGYRDAELEAICCLLLRAAGQKSAMLIDHLFNVQNETNTFRAAHTVHEPTKCGSLLSQQTVYIRDELKALAQIKTGKRITPFSSMLK